ncbi:MAG: AhpC/TSA family protein [Bacteroidales bacterium]|jgi:thiol-disulfide isomerase/thioredoxin|nr:AhpC/TSA family protein [Bacteroidales bacterium]
MKKKRIYISLWVIAVCLCGSVFGQYRIIVKIENTKDTILLLGNYYLDNTYAIDTARLTKKGFVFEKKDKQLEDGIYFFTNTNGKFCEFIISQSRSFDLTTDDADWNGKMKVRNSKENEIYFQYLKATNDLSEKVKVIRRVKDSIGDAEYNRQYDMLRMQNDSVKEAFAQRYPDHLLTKVLNCTKPIIVPAFEFKGDSIKYEEERFVWYKEHFFDNVDFSCRGLLRTPKGVFFSVYDRFWTEVLKYEREDTILLYADKVIAKCTDSMMYRYVVHNITERYLKSNVMGQDKVYVEMIKKYYKTGKAWWMPPSSVESEVARAEKWDNLLLGKTVPNFACPDTSGIWHNLYSLNAKYKILLFWSPECGHCAVEMPKIIEFYNNRDKQNINAEVFSVCTEGSTDEWKKKLQQYKTKWTDVYGMESTMDWREYFDIETTPQIYILDTDNKIIGKKLAGDNIEGYLKAVDEGRFIP